MTGKDNNPRGNICLRPTIAGSSAKAEYERQRAKYWNQWRAALPKRLGLITLSSLTAGTLSEWVLNRLGNEGLGIWIGVLFALSLIQLLLEPAKHAKAWRVGSVGEVRTGRILSKLPPEFVVLHDLSIPGSKANLDHLVIGPTGVFVIDSKNYAHLITESKNGDLWSGRYPLAGAIKTVKWEATKVASVIGLTPESMICVHGTELPRRQLMKNGVLITRPRGLIKLLKTERTVLAPNEVQRLANLARARLQAA